MNRGLAENFVNSELLPNCTKKSTNNARIEYKYLAILVVFPLGQFWLDEVGKVRKLSENSSSWVQPVTRKTSDYLAYMTGNSRQVILHREMVSLVLINAAANRIARRCVLNTMAAIYQTLVSWLSLPRGLLKFRKWLMTSMMLPVSTDLSFPRRSWIRQFLGQDYTYFMALAYRTSSANIANQFELTGLPYSVEFSSSEETSNAFSAKIAFSFA